MKIHTHISLPLSSVSLSISRVYWFTRVCITAVSTKAYQPVPSSLCVQTQEFYYFLSFSGFSGCCFFSFLFFRPFVSFLQYLTYWTHEYILVFCCQWVSRMRSICDFCLLFEWLCSTFFFFFIMIQISIFLSLVSLFIGSRPNLMLWIKLNMIKKRSFANSSVTPCIKSTKDNTELDYSKMDTTQ